MASALLWLEALAGMKALFDLVQGAPDYWESYQRHRAERETIQESRRASTAFSTFSDVELESIIKRIEGCRERFIKQGGGADRARCICSIFKEVMDGNGGVLPRVDNWRGMFDQLRCGSGK